MAFSGGLVSSFFSGSFYSGFSVVVSKSGIGSDLASAFVFAFCSSGFLSSGFCSSGFSFRSCSCFSSLQLYLLRPLLLLARRFGRGWRFRRGFQRWSGLGRYDWRRRRGLGRRGLSGCGGRLWTGARRVLDGRALFQILLGKDRDTDGVLAAAGLPMRRGLLWIRLTKNRAWSKAASDMAILNVGLVSRTTGPCASSPATTRIGKASSRSPSAGAVSLDFSVTPSSEMPSFESDVSWFRPHSRPDPQREFTPWNLPPPSQRHFAPGSRFASTCFAGKPTPGKPGQQKARGYKALTAYLAGSDGRWAG